MSGTTIFLGYFLLFIFGISPFLLALLGELFRAILCPNAENEATNTEFQKKCKAFFDATSVLHWLTLYTLPIGLLGIAVWSLWVVYKALS